MVGSYEGDDSRLTGRPARTPRPRPTEHLPVVDVAPAEDDETSPGETSAIDPPVAAAEPEIETVTKLMGFLRDADD